MFLTRSGKRCERKAWVVNVLINGIPLAFLEVKPPNNEGGIHTYRHTFATQLAQNGVPIQTVSALLGHSDISMTTKYYINVAITDKMDAVLTLDKKQNRKKSVKTNEHE